MFSVLHKIIFLGIFSSLILISACNSGAGSQQQTERTQTEEKSKKEKEEQERLEAEEKAKKEKEEKERLAAEEKAKKEKEEQEKIAAEEKAKKEKEEKEKEKNYTLQGDIFATMPFIAANNLLAKDISYAPVLNLKDKIEKDYILNLISRGEAHITVLTPVEYNLLKPFLDISKINNKFGNAVQKSKFNITCLGKAKLNIDGKDEEAFFIVVSSPEILDIRRQIHDIFIKNGGKKSDFDPEKFYPHITVGFTKRDLHLSDGIIKDAQSCFATLK